MKDINYGCQRTVSLSFQSVDQKIRDALKDVGFGVITEIDLKETFKEKLDLKFKPYKIFGACNPKLAVDAINLDHNVGLLMPCNVIFWQNDDKTVTISFISAETQLSNTSNDKLIQIGQKVDNMISNAIQSI